MPRARTFALCLLALTPLLGGCRDFPELELSEAEFDDKTPYPDLVPLDVLLKEPEPSITDEVQGDLTSRRDALQGTPDGSTAQDEPLLDRLDALRAKRDEKLTGDPVIDDALRKRMQEGITPPVPAE